VHFPTWGSPRRVALADVLRQFDPDSAVNRRK